MYHFHRSITSQSSYYLCKYLLLWHKLRKLKFIYLSKMKCAQNTISTLQCIIYVDGDDEWRDAWCFAHNTVRCIGFTELTVIALPGVRYNLCNVFFLVAILAFQYGMKGTRLSTTCKYYWLLVKCEINNVAARNRTENKSKNKIRSNQRQQWFHIDWTSMLF